MRRRKDSFANLGSNQDKYAMEFEPDKEPLLEEVDEKEAVFECVKSNTRTDGTSTHADIITLNVGGKIISIERDTLCQIEGSLLASMFSGRCEKSLKRDENNRVFLEIDPDCFKIVVKWLRLLRIDPSAGFPRVPAVLETDLQKWMGHLGLSIPRPPVGAKLEWRDVNTSYFDISDKTITLSCTWEWVHSYWVRIGPAWDQIFNIPSEINLSVDNWWGGMFSGNNDFYIYFQNTSINTDMKPRGPTLHGVGFGNLITVRVHHESKQYSVDAVATKGFSLNPTLKGFRMNLPSTDPAFELVVVFTHAGQSLTIV